MERPELYSQRFNNNEGIMAGDIMQDVTPLCPPFDKGGTKGGLFANWGSLASRITHYASRFTLHASRITLHASRITLHASRITLHASRILNHAGFSLVELMVSMALLLLSMAAATTIFTNLLLPFKQQTKIAETNIEGIVGLEMLRRDIEHAGYGLPWVIPVSVSYNESTTTTYNDCSGTAPCNSPRAILSGNNTGTNSSDYLVMKAASVARNDTSQKWTTLKVGNVKKSWDVTTENLSSGDRIIIINPGGTSSQRTLITYSSTFYTTYGSTSSYAPTTGSTDTYIIYGVDPDTALRMPFNRADYYVSTSNVPSKCAAGTGVLTKGVINQSNGNISNPLPLLDCVADMQVIYRRDTNADGTIDNTTDDISALTAQQTREQVKEVRVYILAHEGQMDLSYSYPSSTITVGEFSLGSTFNLSSTIGSTYANYRWKVYTIVVKPENLGG